jgi:transposase
MKAKKISYQGKKVYVGIDVHKKTYAVTVRCEGHVVKRDTLQASPQGLVEYLRRYFESAEIFSAYEAGFSGFGLHRVLNQGGIQNIVVNAASIEIAANDRVKTDRRDSGKISEQLEHGRLKGIFVPEPAQELRRQVSRTREQIVSTRARVAQQIKSKLHYFGLIPPAAPNRALCNRVLKEIEKLEVPQELSLSLRFLIAQWRFLTLQLVELRKQLYAQAKVDEGLEKIYRSVPGIGLIGARVLANELGDLSKRFDNERELFKYTGLTPTEHSSGETVRRGHISRQGSARIRHILVEAAWWSVGVDPVLKESFERIATTRGKKRAIVAIARKLIGRIRACFKAETTYKLGVCI